MKYVGLAAWALILLGLLSGMFWAQTAWGSYWSWDIKETLTLTLFLVFSVGQVAFFEGKWKASRWLLVACCMLVVVTAASSILTVGVHSFI